MSVNLKAEMARRGITTKKLSELTGIPARTLSCKIKGASEWKWSEMQLVQDVFPDCELRYLFETKKAS